MNDTDEIQELDNVEPEGTDQEEVEPKDLSEAFQLYRKQNTQVAEGSVSTGEGTGSTENTGDTEGLLSTGETNYEQENGIDSTPSVDSVFGGSTDDAEQYDYSGATTSLSEQINKQAVQNVANKFNQMGIKKYNVSDLYQRDDQRGTVTFINPDDPNRPFQSRAEAQSWCEAFNKDVDNEFRKAAYAERQSINKQFKPAMDLLEFAPTFEKFSKQKQAVINQLIEPYEVKAGNGTVIGYSCNLNSAAAQADKIIAQFAPQQQTQQPTQQASKTQGQVRTPSVDTKSSQGTTATSEAEPKTLAEAMKMLQQQKKGK